MIRAQVLIVGAGPSGIAAAIAASENGRQVTVLDDNAQHGGQIWREDLHANEKGNAKQHAFDRLARSGATILTRHRVFNAEAPGTLQAIHESPHGVATVHFQYEQLIIATGARERFLPFPGWTLPGVFGAGGLQALAKAGFSVAGKQIIVAGSGPLLLAVATHLKSYGAVIVTVSEQASALQLARFAFSLLSQPSKILQGLRYRVQLSGIPYRTGCWPIAALPSDNNQLRAITLTDGKRTWDEQCDLLACGFHLVPNTELAAMLGCAFRGNFVQVHDHCLTSQPNIFCVGEPTGIAGLEAALLQGEIAGLTCAGKPTTNLMYRAAAHREFAARLEAAFSLRAELQSLAQPDTIVCRCEDVTLAGLCRRSGWTDAKLQTRCGMGPCQGRICGPAVEAIFGWKPVSIRPPLFPVPLDGFCSNDESPNLLQETK